MKTVSILSLLFLTAASGAQDYTPTEGNSLVLNQSNETGSLGDSLPSSGDKENVFEGYDLLPRISATASSELPGFPAHYAIDGDSKPPWKSQSKSHDEWIFIDMGGVYSLSRVLLHWGFAYAKEYVIETSYNAKKWNVKQSVTDGSRGTDIVDFPAGPKARYVRLRMIRGGTKYGLSLEDFVLEGTAPEESQTLAPAPPKETSPPAPSPQLPPPQPMNQVSSLPRISAKSSSALTSNPTEYAIDGGMKTRWQSQPKSDNEWIFIDMGGVYTVSRVVLYWGFAYGKEYVIETSFNAKRWTVRKSVKDGSRRTETIDLPAAVKARYVRMRGEKRGTRYGYTLWELDIEGVLDGNQSPTPIPTKLIPSPPPTPATTAIEPSLLPRVSVTASSAIPRFPSQYAIDGEMETRWQSKVASDAEWIYVDMGGVFSVEQVILYWGVAFAKEYVIETSYNAKQWKMNKTVKNGSRGTATLTLPAGTKGRYVRMRMKQSGTSYGATLWEFVLAGDGQDPGRAPEPVTLPPSPAPIPRTPSPTNKPIPTPLPTQDAQQPVEQGSLLPRVSVTASSAIPRLPSQYAIDGEMETRWQSEVASDAEWIYIDTGDVHTVEQIILYWGVAYAKEYVIESSYNAKRWTVKRVVKDGTRGTATISLPAGTKGRYFRMRTKKSGTKYGASLWEFVLAGGVEDPGRAPEPPTPPPSPTPTLGPRTPSPTKSVPTPSPTKPSRPPSPKPTPSTPTPPPTTTKPPTQAPTTAVNTPNPTPVVDGDAPELELVSAYPLGHCQGECDSDQDCRDGFICMRRNSTESVPGCSGEGKSGRDYCFDPSKATSHRFRLHWEETYRWQGKPHERFFCILFNVSRFEIERCQSLNITKWEFVQLSDFNVGEGYQIRMSGSERCMGLKNGTTHALVNQPCKIDNMRQRWVSGSAGDTAGFHERKFDIRPVNWKGGCVTQPHHPKAGEKVYVEDCDLAQEHTTSLWSKW